MAIDLKAHAAPGPALTWRLRQMGGRTIVDFTGEVDENSDFAPLVAKLAGPVTFNLTGVRRINSYGVREWMNFVRSLSSSSVQLELEGCSTSIVSQLNMIANFRGSARVRSFFAPYLCDRCGREEEKLIELGQLQPNTKTLTLPSFKCSKCGSTLSFDEVPERYLAFLLERG